MGGCEKEMADVEEKGAEAEDITMVQSTTPTTTAKPALCPTGTATATGTSIAPRSGPGVALPND